MFTTVIEIVRRNPGLTISRNAATYKEYHRGLFQMLPGFWLGLYSSYRYILFSSNMEQSPSPLVKKVNAVFRRAHCVTLSWARLIHVHIFFLYLLALAVWWRCQYRDYTALVVLWLMNICQLEEWSDFHTLFLWEQLNIILPSIPRSPKWSVHFMFTD